MGRKQTRGVHNLSLVACYGTLCARMRSPTMDDSVLGFGAIENLKGVLALLGNDVAVGMVVFLATASLIALCIPGILIPTAMAAGALLGTWPAAAAVVTGTLVGSQCLFLVARRFGKDRLRARFGKRLERFECRRGVDGFWYVAGLRLFGIPHFIVTAGSALTPMRSATFATATLLGVMPAITMAAAAGAALQ